MLSVSFDVTNDIRVRHQGRCARENAGPVDYEILRRLERVTIDFWLRYIKP